MSTAKKQKAIRTVTLNKIAGLIHVPQNTLRENYLGTLSMLVEHDPATYARDIPLDADQLNFFLNDKARSTEIAKMIAKEEKEKEKEKEPPKKAKKEKAIIPEKTAPEKEQVTLPVAPAVEEPVEKKPPAKTQSTLFDGF
jgi:replication factor C large subunit